MARAKSTGKRADDAGSLDLRLLVAAAREVRPRAHAPYSRYRVGAAIATASGAIFAGCNVENASYGACLCAERNAIAQMVASGEGDPVACVVVTDGPEPGSPCGICRQVLAEFARDMVIVLVAETPYGAKARTTSLAELLPDAFGADTLAAATQTTSKRAAKKAKRAAKKAKRA